MRRADANGNGNGWMAKATGGNAGSALENPNQINFTVCSAQILRENVQGHCLATK